MMIFPITVTMALTIAEEIIILKVIVSTPYVGIVSHELFNHNTQMVTLSNPTHRKRKEGKVNMAKLTLSVPEAADVLGVSSTKMYEIVKIKGFPTIHVGKRILVSAKGLERWIEEQAARGYCGPDGNF